MSNALAWTMLVASGLIDVAWAIATKKADGFRNPEWTIVSLVLLAAFVLLLTRALSTLPLGVAYTAWVGIGAVGTIAAGILLFGEPLQPARLAFAGLVVIGVVGLKVASA